MAFHTRTGQNAQCGAESMPGEAESELVLLNSKQSSAMELGEVCRAIPATLVFKFDL